MSVLVLVYGLEKRGSTKMRWLKTCLHCFDAALLDRKASFPVT